MGSFAIEQVPLIEPECAPFYFVNGWEIEIKDGLLYFVAWVSCSGCRDDERRIVFRGATPLPSAMESNKVFQEQIAKIRNGGH